MRTAGSAIVDVLADAGVRRFYTVPGESFLEILDGVEQHSELTLVSNRHEGGASFMAEADGKLCGVPAVAMATRGVGAANLAIGVHTAYQDSTPMIVLLGQVESDFLHREAFQEVDLTAFYAPITKWAVTASRADRLPELVARAYRIATTGRPGPVMIALPADLLAEPYPEDGTADPYLSGAMSPAPAEEDVREIARKLAAAASPVIIAGGGAQNARHDLIDVAETYSAGVYSSFRRQDVFPNDHPLYLGHLGVAAPGRTLEALERADLVVVLGSRLSEITTQSYRVPLGRSDVVQIDIDHASVGAVVPVTTGIVADAAQALRALARVAPDDLPTRDWRAGHAAWVETATIPPPRSNRGVDPAQVFAAMAEWLPDDTLVTNDAGNFSAFLHRYWRFNHPRTQLGPTNGAMGYAIPAAVAAKIAAPERTVVAAVGDGGFLMTAAELEVGVRHRAPVIVLAFRNGLYGTIAMHQARSFGRVAGVDIGEVNLASFARSLGADAITVADNESLGEAMRQASVADNVTVLDLVCDPELITPGDLLADLTDDGGNRV
jgi:acetolactate synthase I/II/III large subunit